MSELPDIIKSDIINKDWDIFWEHSSAGFEEKPVLVISSSYERGTSEDIQLQKILQACALTTEQYNILQVNEGQHISWHQLRDLTKPKVVILLGVMPEQLGISAMFRLFVPNSFNERIWIAGLSLAELEKQPEAKKQLWGNGLKPVFVDKTIGNF